MGKDNTPVRKVFDFAEERFIKDLPLIYVLTVTTQSEGRTFIHGLFTWRKRKIFDEAIALSQEKIKPLSKGLLKRQWYTLMIKNLKIPGLGIKRFTGREWLWLMGPAS